jgi:hypothetical protein
MPQLRSGTEFGGVHEKTDSTRIDIAARRYIRGCAGFVEHRLKHFGSKLDPIHQHTDTQHLADTVVYGSIGDSVFQLQLFGLRAVHRRMPPGLDWRLHTHG